MWVYEQSTGRLLHNKELVATGYSGSGKGKNNPAMQNVHDTGPIPCGQYYIGHPLYHTTHGPFVLPLFPDHDNQMFGRGGFLIHGDKIGAPGTASEGCIVMPRDIREQIDASKDCELWVVKG